MPNYPQRSDSAFRPYAAAPQPSRRFQYPAPTQQFRNELISPPDESWPQAEYFDAKKGQAAEMPVEAMPRGAPVEVVPPPGVPVSEVGMPISDKPERGFRPMKEQQELEALEESISPPKPKTSKPPVMREVEHKRSPLHGPVEKPKQEYRDTPPDVAAPSTPAAEIEMKQIEDDPTLPLSSGMSIHR